VIPRHRAYILGPHLLVDAFRGAEAPAKPVESGGFALGGQGGTGGAAGGPGGTAGLTGLLGEPGSDGKAG